jgi:hypothetical protein
MTYKELQAAFASVPKPRKVQGDSWGIDATTEDIWRLINTEPSLLEADDFSGYIGMCTTGGIDDLRYLLPTLLRIWHHELSAKKGSWFIEHLHQELSRTDLIENHLNETLRSAVITFMRHSLLERIGQENPLRIVGNSPTHNWFGFMASYGVFTEDIPTLWQGLWEMPTPGHAVAVVQYASCLICKEGDNPVFAPWRSDIGGGSPLLWDYNSMGFDERWKESNVSFLQGTLSVNYLQEHLMKAERILSDRYMNSQVQAVLSNLLKYPERAQGRCSALPKALSIPSSPEGIEWKLFGVS